MQIDRRTLIMRLFAILCAPFVRAQEWFHAASLATLVFQTTKTTGFSPSFSKTGATLYWKWPDGTYTSSNAPSKNLAAGTKTVSVQSRDGFNKVDQFNGTSQQFSGALPSFAAFTALTDFRCYGNAFTGALPSFAACTALVGFQCYSNSFSGALPSFAACTALVIFYCFSNNFTGALPSFAACTALTDFRCYGNAFTGALPSFAACTALTGFQCYSNSFSGALPSFATCTLLTIFNVSSNAFSGTLPSFATCTLLTIFSVSSNAFSGTLPSFATCTLLTSFNVSSNAFSGTLPSFATCTLLTGFSVGGVTGNQFSGVTAGSFATQKSLNTANFAINALPAAAVNQILADFVVSLGISGRVVCTVTLSGGTNAAPTGQGILDEATLIAAGWTVTTN
jgi:hypothetical protein